ncbi:MAG: DUF3466 family protein [Magnetococcales bacterium]|nr:DUF3466 family protein [Magnetococcales bacterium]
MKRLFSILALVVMLLSCGNAYAYTYTITDLGSLDGAYSSATSLSDSGTVVGSSQIADTSLHAFMWDSTNLIQDLGISNSGLDVAHAYSINNSGYVVGTTLIAETPDYTSQAFMWDSTNGTQLLPKLGGYLGTAYDINNSGVVVGSSSISTASTTQYAFSWDSTNGVTNLGSFNNEGSRAKSINDNEEIVGASLHSSGEWRAFLWDSTNGMQDILSKQSEAQDINSSGQIAGQYMDGSYEKAFIWDSTNGETSIGWLGDGNNSDTAFSINDSGTVVGLSGGKAFVYDAANGIQDLNLLLSNDLGQTLDYAYAVNSSGQISATGTLNGETRAFLLTPVPTPIPGTGLLLGTGLLGLAWLKRKKQSVPINKKT